MVEKTAAFRQPRAADMRAYRKRQNAGIALFYVAVDETTFEVMKRYAGGPTSAATAASDRQCIGGDVPQPEPLRERNRRRRHAVSGFSR